MAKRSQLFMLPMSENQPPGRLAVLLLILLPLYAPFAWILNRPGPWDEKRWVWLKSWPALPGFIVQSLDIFEGRPIWVSYACMAAVALFALVVLFRIGRTGRAGLILAILLAAGYSGYNSWLAFQSF